MLCYVRVVCSLPNAGAVSRFLNLIKNKPTITLSRKNLERVVFTEVLRKVLIPLAQESILESTYSELESIDTVQLGQLGMGVSDTWHGKPDGRLRGCVLEEMDVIRRESSDSDPGTITVDGKKMFEEQHMSQLITTNVVSSFVEHNLHKQENPIVPSLMLNSHWVAVSLYDCINDYLIVSE